jgi:type IV secretory pathway protease TraF
MQDPAVGHRAGRLLVKRVAATDGETVTVHGDNAAHSTDSRHIGPLPRSAVRGRVVYRYAPSARVGRL